MRASNACALASLLLLGCGTPAAVPAGWGDTPLLWSTGTEVEHDCSTREYPNVYDGSWVKVTERDHDGFTLEFGEDHPRRPLSWVLEDCTVTDRRGTRIDFVCPGTVRPESLRGDPATRPVLTRATGTFIGPTGIVFDHELELLENVCGEGGDGTCRDDRPEGCVYRFSTAHGTADLPEDEDE